MEADYRVKIVLIIALSLAAKLVFLNAHPLYLDDCLYSEMSMEQWDHPSLVPTYLGYDTSWKPPLFFWAYAPLAKASGLFSSDVDLVFRVPNLVFGALNVWLVFALFRKISDGERAFYAAVLFAFCALVISVDLRVMLDTFNTTLMLA